VDVNELIDVAAWYVSWQRREHVNGEMVTPPAQSAFIIQGLTLNYIEMNHALNHAKSYGVK
jgi:hypothetical protein